MVEFTNPVDLSILSAVIVNSSLLSGREILFVKLVYSFIHTFFQLMCMFGKVLVELLHDNISGKQS